MTPTIPGDVVTRSVSKFLCTASVLPSARTVCAVVVTYHPDEGLCDRIKRIAPQVNQTVVVDNGSPSRCVEQLRALATGLRVQLILNGRNEGLANAINTGCHWAIEHGYPWVLYLDQDTVVAPDMVESLVEAFGYCSHPERLAVIGSNYYNTRNGEVFWDRNSAPNERSATERVVVLMSGSLLSMKAFQIIGGFRSDFFVDCVDFEYCLRARSKGFHVLRTVKPIMEHAIGHPTEHRLFWKTVPLANQSPMRHYFMARNSLILIGNYLLQEPKWISKYLWAYAKLVFCAILFEEQRISKSTNIVRGYIDALLGRTDWRPE